MSVEKVKQETWQRKLQKFNQKNVDAIFWLLPSLMILSGFLNQNPKLFFESFFYCCIFLEIWLLTASFLIYNLSKLLGTKLQDYKKYKPMTSQEIFGTTATVVTVSSIAAWSITKFRLGQEIAFSMKIVPSFTSGFLQFVVLIFASDFFTYWKHWLLHRPYLFAYHKYHHLFHDPSCFAGFAQHPVDALATFFPIYLSCLSIVQISGYVFIAYLMFFVHLNLYMHSGYSIKWIESLISPLWINTSDFHNVHHEKTHCNIGEVSPLWDYIIGTYDKKK
jgi:sterol desaturase/sphingolipid hydroxylase (fatty acid hydroxylase superfamily)